MQAHHLVWLDIHPERTSDWLKRMMLEGFHVHHIDGDHSNNHPGNLALIEGADHMRLHGLFSLAKSDISEAARKGARIRWAKMPPEKRAKQARHAANSRWKRYRRDKAMRDGNGTGR